MGTINLMVDDRQHFPDGALADLVRYPQTSLTTLWQRGAVLLDIEGIGVAVGLEHTSDFELVDGPKRETGIPVAIIAADHQHPQACAVWEGIVHREDLSPTIRRLQPIATRLIELRAGGWHLRFHPVASGPSRHTFSADLVEPITRQVSFTFPARLDRRPRRQRREMRQVLGTLHALTDSPLAQPSTMSDCAAMAYWSDETAALTARMIIARYPHLDVEQALDLADQVNAYVAPGQDRLSLIEAFYKE